MNDSFINSSGALSVTIPADEVNWFDFLWFSRGTNSLRGGWNYKSYWRDRGVDVLSACAANGILAQWTAQSLVADSAYLPTPRSKDFKLNREHTIQRRQLGPAFVARQSALEEASENELSFALFEGGLGKLQRLEGLDLIGYEVPLVEDSEGQLKVDLLGISETPRALHILELKKAKNHSDSPLMALTEAICYGLQVLRCKKHLLGCDKLKDRAQAFSHIHLSILAPPKYWEHWSESAVAYDAVKWCTERFSRIIEGVNAGIPSSYGGARFSVSAQVLSLASENVIDRDL